MTLLGEGSIPPPEVKHDLELYAEEEKRHSRRGELTEESALDP